MNYGWIPDYPDQRDKLYYKVMPPSLDLPSSVDLRPFCPPVEDQGELGSCTAQALVGALEFLELKELRDQGLKPPFPDYSRLQLYYDERINKNADTGAQLRNGIKTLALRGVANEKLWPYTISKFKVKPPPAVYADALKHQILKYYRITTQNEMQTCLAKGYPFVFGFAVYESFESDQVAKTGVVPMPKMSERALGGHAVMGVGYNNKDKRFIVRNSWGTNWGLKGYFTIPYAYLTNPNLADDFWAIYVLEE